MSLESLSFKNLVNFYKPELLRVLNGERVSEVFSRFTRRRLARLGLLCLVYRGGGRRLQVSEKVLKILERAQQ